jgi:hypothetical protein
MSAFGTSREVPALLAYSAIGGTLSFTGFDPRAVFGSIHPTCLSALVTDWAMETWYHPSIA